MRLIIGGYAQGKLNYVLRQEGMEDWSVLDGEDAGHSWDDDANTDARKNPREDALGAKAQGNLREDASGAEAQGNLREDASGAEAQGNPREDVSGAEAQGDSRKDTVGINAPKHLQEDATDGKRNVVLNHFHSWVKARMRQGGCPEKEILVFLEKNPHCIIISDEIGNGIVPVDAFEREYRERTGRILVELAARADEVVRVICGIGQKIK